MIDGDVIRRRGSAKLTQEESYRMREMLDSRPKVSDKWFILG